MLPTLNKSIIVIIIIYFLMHYFDQYDLFELGIHSEKRIIRIYIFPIAVERETKMSPVTSRNSRFSTSMYVFFY